MRFQPVHTYRPCSIIFLAVTSAASGERFKIAPSASKLILSYTWGQHHDQSRARCRAVTYLSASANVVLSHSPLQHRTASFHYRPLVIFQARLEFLHLLRAHDIFQQHLPQHRAKMRRERSVDPVVSIERRQQAGSLRTSRRENGSRYCRFSGRQRLLICFVPCHPSR